MSALNMGILKAQSKGYWQNMSKAAIQTNVLGATAADLAKMQANYSESIGRMVVLSEQGNIAMAQMAEGTTLGQEGAAEMAASMDMFAISAIGARDKVQETVDLAHKMGLNASKVLKSLQQNLKLGQTYNFKAGVKGIMQMTAYSEKLKINMQSIAGFAAQVSNPEGAVEAAATLQTLGGAWSQLADPFKLMYEARNDMEAFTKSIGEATAGTFRFNRATGEIDKSAMELNRLREVAKATNIPFEELSEMAHRMAMIKSIDMDISPQLKGDKEAKEFLESSATWSKDKKGFVISISGGPEQLIKDLNAAEIKNLVSAKESLESRAIASKTFDEQWTNIVNTFKTALMPMMQGIFDGLSKAMTKFTDWAKKGDLFEKLRKTGESIVESVVAIGKFIADNPMTSMIAAIGAIGLFKAAQWFMNGRMLAMGFNSAAGGRGGGGMGGMMMGGSGGGASGGFDRSGYSRAGWAKTAFGKGMSMKDRGFAAGQALKGPKMGFGAKMGAGIAGTALGGMLTSQSENMDPNSTGSKMFGTLGGAATGAGYGAMLGVPGMIAGGIIGGGIGAYNQFGKDPVRDSYTSDPNQLGGYNNTLQDFIYRPGEGAIPFSKNDDLSVIGHKAGGPIESKANANGSSTVKHTFDEVKISGKIELVGSNGQKIDEDLLKNNPQLVRTLSRLIQTEIKSATAGGKVNNTAST
jgi:hypothetical protein